MDRDLDATFTDESLHAAFALHHMSANGGIQPPPVEVWKFVLQQILLELHSTRCSLDQPVLPQLHDSQLGKRINATRDVKLTEFSVQIDMLDFVHCRDQETDEDEEERTVQPGSQETVVQFDVKVEGLWGHITLKVCMSSAPGYELSYQVIGVLQYFRRGTRPPDHWEEDLQKERSGTFGEYFQETQISDMNEARLHDMLVEYRKHVLSHRFRCESQLYEPIKGVEFHVEDWIQPSGALLKWLVGKCFQITQRSDWPSPYVCEGFDYQQRLLDELKVQAANLPQLLQSKSELVLLLTREAVALADVFWKEVLAIPAFLTWDASSLLVWSHFFTHVCWIQRLKEFHQHLIERQQYRQQLLL